MTTRADDLRSIYRKMDSEELLTRVKAGTLSEDAKVVASDELAYRGVRLESIQPETNAPTTKRKRPNIFLQAWSGKVPLWAVFWIGGFFLNFPFGLASSFQSAPLYLLGMISRSFWLLLIWRSAPRSSGIFWAFVARFYVVFDLAISLFILLRTFASP